MIKSKKIVGLFLLVVIAGALLPVCVGKTQIEKAQSKIVSIGEQFLDYELTIDEAKSQLESISVPTSDGTGGRLLSGDKDYLEYLIVKSRHNNNIFDEIKEKIQYIKKHDYN